MADPLLSPGLAADWLKRLHKVWSTVRESRKQEILEIQNVFGDPELLAKVYVEPDCQHTNPADHDESEPGRAIRQPVREWLNQFLRGEFQQRDGRNTVFVLSDAGMGKTSLLMMLKLTHLLRFWPDGLDFRLLKLDPKALEEIEKIRNRGKTVLLLDALDEDSSAWGRIEERLVELLQATQSFRQVILTCRTQFFPEGDRAPIEKLGKVEIGGFICNLLYLSPFSDAQVEDYLRKIYPDSWLDVFLQKWGKHENLKRQRAWQVVEPMRSLRMRPMLLAHVRDFLEDTVESWSEYRVYQALVRHWLLREQRKQKGRLTEMELWNACQIVAVHLQATQKRVLAITDLAQLLESQPEAQRIEAFDVGGRSLLNRTSEGGYRFSHYSIQEFLVAHSLLQPDGPRAPNPLRATDQLMSFLSSWISEDPPARVTGVRWSELVPSVQERATFSLVGASLRGADLRGAFLRGVAMKGADLRNADLRGALLDHANLRNAILSGAKLQGASLNGAHLAHAKLDQADARNASFIKADLTGADLSFSNFGGADLTDARLQGSVHQGAALAFVRGVTEIAGERLEGSPKTLRVVPQLGQTSPILCLSWSPEGHILATGGGDGMIRLVRAHDRAVLAVLDGHQGAVRSLAWDKTGKRLASGAGNGTVYIWDTRSSKRLESFQASGDIHALAWNPDSDALAIGSRDGTVLCRFLRKTPTAQITNGDWGPFVTPLGWTPDGKVVTASNQSPSTVSVWTAPDWTSKWTFQCNADVKAWSFQDWRLALISGHQIHIWDLRERKHQSFFCEVRPLCLSLSTSPALAIGFSDRSLGVLDLESMKLSVFPVRHAGEVQSLAWEPDSSLLASGSSDGIKIWDTASGQVLQSISATGVTEVIRGAAWSPSQLKLACGDANGRLCCWDVSRAALLWEEEAVASGLLWTSDGSSIAFISSERDLEVRSEAGRPHLFLNSIGAQAVAWAPEGQRLAEVEDDVIRVRNLKTGQIQSLKTSAAAWGVSWNPQRDIIAAALRSGEIEILDIVSGRVLWCLPYHLGENARDRNPLDRSANCVQWNQAGSQLAAGDHNGNIVIWNLQKADMFAAMLANPSEVRCLAWNPDHLRIAAGLFDGTVVVWRVTPRNMLFSISYPGRVEALRWGADDESLAVVTSLGIAYFLDLASSIPEEIGRFYVTPGLAGLAVTSDGYVYGPPKALRSVRLADGWALYDLNDFPERRDPERVRRRFQAFQTGVPFPDSKP